jgi:hypothetical protein
LPYVVAGGAVACGYLSVVVATKTHLAVVFGAAVTVGIAAGMTVGWLLLGLYLRRVEMAAAGRRRLDVAIVLLTVPAYVVAGWVSAWVGWVVAVVLSRPTPEPDPPNAWVLLIAAAVVIYPLSYAFAQRYSDRPEDFIGALRSATEEIDEEPGSFRVLGAFLIGLAWFVGVLFALFAVSIGVQVIFRDQLKEVDFPSWVGMAIIVAWIGLSYGGTAWTLRRVRRGPPRLHRPE